LLIVYLGCATPRFGYHQSARAVSVAEPSLSSLQHLFIYCSFNLQQPRCRTVPAQKITQFLLPGVKSDEAKLRSHYLVQNRGEVYRSLYGGARKNFKENA
jgi:hypothetical protein